MKTRSDFLNSLKLGTENQERVLRKYKILKLIDNCPELLENLSLEQLKVVRQFYMEGLN